MCCGEPTSIRARCGSPRTAECAGSGPESVSSAHPARRAAAGGTRAVRATRTTGRKAQQATITETMIAALAEGKAPKFLDALEGAFAPLRVYDDAGHRSKHHMQPELPGITFGGVQVVTGFAWQRPYSGRVAVLDRSGAWLAAMSSALVAHSGLANTGEIEYDGMPGYYQLIAHPWYESAVMPSPIGNVTTGEPVWLPAPTVHLLRDLVRQGRWPDVDVLDSYTAPGVRLTDWTTLLKAVRAYAITTYGRDSEQYDMVKRAIGQVTSLLLGEWDGSRRVWHCLMRRADYTHTWQSQGSSTLWRWHDACRQVAPELPPVALQNTDELVVPYDAVEILTTTRRPGDLDPMMIDPSGIKLGSFKIKSIEIWEE